MIERPSIPDEKIISVLRENYAIPTVAVEFLPLGWDTASWSYRIDARHNSYFLKIRRNIVNPAGILLPRYLKEQGINQVLAPLLSPRGEPWKLAEGFYFILYPFVQSEQVLAVGMSDAHWVEFGSVLQRLHTTGLPRALLAQMKRERFVPPRLEWIKDTHAHVNRWRGGDPFQRELASFWLDNHSTIAAILQRMEILVQKMHGVHIEFVPCHGDVHTGNLLITRNGRLFIVDWEDARLAPKERDLMFLPGDLGAREEGIFFQGYGKTSIHPLAQAYYRHHWCIEDLGFAEHIFTEEQTGEKTRKNAIFWFKNLFAEGNSIETALKTQVDF